MSDNEIDPRTVPGYEWTQHYWFAKGEGGLVFLSAEEIDKTIADAEWHANWGV